jgi:uncharacterized protein YndB with AHSA1/START domain
MFESRNAKLTLGIIVPNFVSLVFIGISKFAVDFLIKIKTDDYTAEGGTTLFVFSVFFVIPLVMGITSAYFWKDLQFKNGRYVLWSLLNTFVAIIMSAIFLKEGIICLIIVSPVIFGCIVAGAFIGKVMFRRKNNTLNSSIIGILLVIFSADLFSKHEYTNKVTDTMIVNAPINKVWQYVVEYEPIKEKENYWLFQVGMPSPMQSTVDGHCVGAGRKCIFSNGYTFDEKMVVYKPNEELTFDITNQPRDPEIMGHIDILRGQFILKDNGNGTTTVTGNSWYKLYVFPVWYFDIWAESITRNVHLRVMQHIKTLSETNV